MDVVLFQGVDATGDIGLWETNGTASGTFEIPVAGANASGLSPSNLTAFNSEVLFEGKDSSGFGLWVTNGTTSGTQEIAGTSGLSPNNLTVFNGQVLFSGASGLWTTNGSVAGEVAGTAGLNPSDLTVFNGKVLFNGIVSGTVTGLWTYNGTTTQQLKNITGAATTGLGFDPSDLTVLGSEVFFSGINNTGSGQVGLWETNGTATGTKEIAVANASATGLHPTNMVAFGGEVLFSGVNNSGHIGLWETNGVATNEIAVTDAFSTGLHPQDMTVYNGEVLFNGLDNSGSGNFGLWVWNGTSATEVGGVPGTPGYTGITGARAPASGGLDPTDFTLYNGELLFRGYDSSGNLALWETNGTAAGTKEISSGFGPTGTGLAPFDLTPVNVVNAPPTIAGTVSGQTTTSETPVRPFAHATVGDANVGATDTLTITLGGAGGTLIDGTGFSDLTTVSAGVYRLSGTAGAITSELDALLFTPTTGAPGTTSTTTFTLSDLSSAGGAPVVDTTTTLTDSDPAVAPTISGTGSRLTTTSETPVRPFAHATLGDANVGATDTLTITLGGAGGTLSGTGLSGGGGGVYALSGTAAAITSELHTLFFAPTAGEPNTSSTTTFTLSDQSSASIEPIVDSTTNVVDSDPAGAPVSSRCTTGYEL